MSDLFEYSTSIKTALPSKIANMLRREIYENTLKAGDHLNETQIASRMGVSRGPVRDALRILETEHLVVRTPHRGAFVTWLTRKDVDEIYSFREALELLALRFVLH